MVSQNQSLTPFTFFTFTLMLLQLFQAFWKKNFTHLSIADCHLLIAVSGGVDSVVLTDLLYKSGFSFSIAHCNFQLRGEESDHDEAFVKSLANQYDKPLFTQKFDTKTYASQQKLSIQEAARKLRYDWFSEIIIDPHLSANHPSSTTNLIATAHQANDNIETLLINLFRGTGISGLHGILPRQNNIIRPMLFAKREEIEAYAKDNNLHWVEDSSNATDKYIRNFFRHQLVPLVKEAFANAEDNLLQNIQRFSEAEILYKQAVDVHKKKLLKSHGNEIHIPVLKLQKATPLPTVIWEIIKEYGFTSLQVDDIKNLLLAENGKYVASASHRIIRNRAWLIIAPVQAEEAQHILIEEKDTEVTYEEGTILLKTKDTLLSTLSNANNIAMLDAKQIHYPLLLRKWKQGDYFYPLGMKKKKKLSKFFIDNKLSKTEKEKAWILEMNKKIIWVIGHRIDDRFKITASTIKTLVIENKTLNR